MDTNTLRTGPVAITGASGQVGRALQQRLAELPSRIVPLGRGDDLTTGLADARVLVHLAGGLRPRRPDTYASSNLGTVRAAVEALPGSAVQRVVFLSFVTADPSSTNPYLRCKGLAEQVLAGSGVPTVVFRTGHVIGTPLAPGPTATSLLARRGQVSVLGDGQQRIAPILLADVVDAVIRAALDPDTPVGIHPLTGPEVMTMDELVRTLNGDDVRIRHLAPRTARALSVVLPSLPRPLVDVMVADAVAAEGVPSTVRAFGVQPHDIRHAWASGRPVGADVR